MGRSWLDSRAATDPTLGAADRRAAALGPAAHAIVLAAGDRLAAISDALAERFYRHAAAAWEAFGGDGFARWVALGEELAPVAREGAMAYFALPPARLGGLAAATAWCRLGREVARTSRRLAVAFFERTAPADGSARLSRWVEAGLALHAAPGWRGAFAAQAYFEAAATALAPAHYQTWAELGLALAPTVGERAFFAAPPRFPAGWTEDDALLFLRTVRALAAASPRHAAAVYRELPAALAGLPAPVGAALVRVFARVGAHAVPALADVAPAAGALLRAVPVEHRLEALACVESLATRFPEAALAALRVLPRLYDEASHAQVHAWFHAGRAIALEGPAAGTAYFALASQTSLRVLRAASTAADLEDSAGVWRKLIHIMSGEAASIRAEGHATLRPPLEEPRGVVALPARIDWLPAPRDNRRVFRFLATQMAGRREFGTYDGRLPLPAPPGLLHGLFLLAEGVRVHHRLCAAYPGLAVDARRVSREMLERSRHEVSPTHEGVLDAVLALVLAVPAETRRPAWLGRAVTGTIARVVAPLREPAATVDDAVRAAHALAALLGAGAPGEEASAWLALDELPPDDSRAASAAGTAGGDAPTPGELPPESGPPAEGAAGHPPSIEELRRLLAAGARIGQGNATGGLPITQLAGKMPPAELEALRRLLGEPGPARAPERRRDGAAEGPCFFYDEWDHRIGDYRARWCRLREVNLGSDAGEFFRRTLDDYARFVPEVRRLFQRTPPAEYRTVRGLEDGEDFDLNAVVEARIELRARRTPSTRLYRARRREAREVATLFLLDMSASTDEPLAQGAADRPGRRIIDAIKEALVIMSAALDELGDAYAIYGFSGQGRDGVEVYPVKGFGERLSATVKGRIGAIEPRRSTRMGAALRHAARALAPVAARARHLILLSDGFPQDQDYGEDRRSHDYGIRDTAVALEEATSAGIEPFCITVDRAGHDYLREMCDASRYLVIDDVAALPRELPRIYRRVVRAA